MKRSNCFFHATWRWVRRGGYLIMRRSVAGPFPHFIHADDLPENLPVSQYVPNDGVPFSLLFDGHVERAVGTSKPPAVVGRLDWALLGFWVLYFIGIVAAIGWVFAIFWPR